MISDPFDIPSAVLVRSAAQQPVARSTIVCPGENTSFDFCDVLAAGFGRPGNGSNDRYTYDAPVIHGHTSPNADILSRQVLYQYLRRR